MCCTRADATDEEQILNSASRKYMWTLTILSPSRLKENEEGEVFSIYTKSWHMRQLRRWHTMVAYAPPTKQTAKSNLSHPH